MRQIFISMVACLLIVGCTDKKEPAMAVDTSAVPEEKDSTIYGVCGEGTSMNSVELITGQGDTLVFMKDVDAVEDPVKGGMAVGDNLALMPGTRVDGEDMMACVVNLTSLLGKWTSIDKNFEIKDDGVVAIVEDIQRQARARALYVQGVRPDSRLPLSRKRKGHLRLQTTVLRQQNGTVQSTHSRVRQRTPHVETFLLGTGSRGEREMLHGGLWRRHTDTVAAIRGEF